jgi:putative two-component system response regulator
MAGNKIQVAIQGGQMPDELKVLILEDRPDDAELILYELRNAGYQPIWKRVDSEEAYIASIQDDLDVILADFNLPQFNALRALQLLNQKGFDIPFIIVSGDISEETAVDCMKLGAADYLLKDRLTRLGKAIERALEQKTLRDEQRRSQIELELAHQELAEAYDATIEGWSRALDMKDRETEGHTQRVTDLTVKLCRLLKVPEEQLVHTRRGCLLHDIGKMGIPDQILLKTGPLTDDDWGAMHMHPVYAYEMLKSIEYLRPALEIPYYHHERWNGSGYPFGLRGQDIPLTARIFMVADVWDALRSDRPYRKSCPPEEVIEYLQVNRGILFDPVIVDVFLNMLSDEETLI